MPSDETNPRITESNFETIVFDMIAISERLQLHSEILDDLSNPGPKGGGTIRRRISEIIQAIHALNS
jgi:hypothetical protein